MLAPRSGMRASHALDASRSCGRAIRCRITGLIMQEPVDLSVRDGIATLTLSRGKVNAIDGELVDRLTEHLITVENDDNVRAIIVTGRGSFFTFGFDVPH